MVRNQHFHCPGLGSILDWGTKILQTACTAKKEKRVGSAISNNTVPLLKNCSQSCNKCKLSQPGLKDSTCMFSGFI